MSGLARGFFKNFPLKFHRKMKSKKQNDYLLADCLQFQFRFLRNYGGTGTVPTQSIPVPVCMAPWNGSVRYLPTSVVDPDRVGSATSCRINVFFTFFMKISVCCPKILKIMKHLSLMRKETIVNWHCRE
jgi:hypothetical protein